LIRLAKTGSQTPAADHRLNRLWAVFHLPYRSGRSCQCAPDLCRAARALVGFEQKDLAAAAGVSKSTIGPFEIKDESARLSRINNRPLLIAFVSAGLEFLAENGGGPGVRLTKRPKG
jgi:hypothetical protein